jgi:serine/threonine-protein kinase
MGEVYLASHEGPGGFSKTVVVKLILPHVAQEPLFVEMFMNEARLAGMLTHPNIVQVFDFGQAESRWYQVMEFVDGVSLKTLQQRLMFEGQPLASDHSAWIVSQLLAGLDFAHNLADEAGRPLELVHRDVSPDNILISTSGGVKLSDFGIARSTTTSSYTEPGVVRGKMAYLAPERFTGHSLDRRVDIYAAGIVLYRLLTGTVPFRGDTDAAVMHAILSSEPKPILELTPSVSPRLAAVVETAMHRDPAKRFQTAAAFRAELLRVMGSTSRQYDVEIASIVRPIHQTDVERTSTAKPAPVEEISLFTTPTVGRFAISQKVRRRMAWAVVALIFAVIVAGLVSANLKARSDATQGPAPRVDSTPASPANDARPFPDASVLAVVDSNTPVVRIEQTKQISRPRGSGRVEFRVNPWAEVYLNKKLIGTTPMQAIAFPAGEYVFVLKNTDLKIERSVMVRVVEGKAITLKTDLLD